MRTLLKILMYFISALLAGMVILFLIGGIYFFALNEKAKLQLKEKRTITSEGLTFRDLNNNGKLDIYEDYRQPADKRVADLLSRMTLEEKVGLMWHPPIGIGHEGEVLGRPDPFSFFLGSSYKLIITQKINHFNIFKVPEPRFQAAWYNKIQEIAEQTRLGIPITISSDPRHGINNFIGNDLLGSYFSKWPEPLGLAATGDTALVAEFGRIANAEYRSVGIRTALHPMADLATEPRWARMNGTFGEDATLAANMTFAYIRGFQGDSLGKNSVACMVKHWPGGGPQGRGDDAHFRYGMDQVYPGKNFDYHLIPFKAAFKAGARMVMPYYGVPAGQTKEDVGMSFNKEIITDLLRNKMGYDGIVCTDWGIIEGFKLLGWEIMEGKSWGVDSLSVKERIKKVIDAGVDQFGGNQNTSELIGLVREGKISEARIDDSARRLLKAKFIIGLFDNPYIDPDQATRLPGKAEFMEAGKLAQRKSIVLLKNKKSADAGFTLPLQGSPRIYVENINKGTAGSYAQVVDSLDDADVAILRMTTPWEPRHGDMIERMFHQGDLDFKEPELSRLVKIMETKPTIVCIYLDRAAVISEIAAKSAALLADFGAYDDAVLDVIFGKFNPSAKLPVELPSSMDAVRNQKEDVPYDSGKPLFPFGFGLSYSSSVLRSPSGRP
jgi:beta-glucosidase